MPTKKGLRLLHGGKNRFIVCPQGDMIEAAKLMKEHHPEFSKHRSEGEKSSRHSRGSSRATKPHRRSMTKAHRRRPKLMSRLRSNCRGPKRLTKFYFARSTWNFLQTQNMNLSFYFVKSHHHKWPSIMCLSHPPRGCTPLSSWTPRAIKKNLRFTWCITKMGQNFINFFVMSRYTQYILHSKKR